MTTPTGMPAPNWDANTRNAPSTPGGQKLGSGAEGSNTARRIAETKLKTASMLSQYAREVGAGAMFSRPSVRRSELDLEWVVPGVVALRTQEDRIRGDALVVQLQVQAHSLAATDDEAYAIGRIEGVEVQHQGVAAVGDIEAVLRLQVHRRDVVESAVAVEDRVEVVLGAGAMSVEMECVVVMEDVVAERAGVIVVGGAFDGRKRRGRSDRRDCQHQQRDCEKNTFAHETSLLLMGRVWAPTLFPRPRGLERDRIFRASGAGGRSRADGDLLRFDVDILGGPVAQCGGACHADQRANDDVRRDRRRRSVLAVERRGNNWSWTASGH